MNKLSKFQGERDDGELELRKGFLEELQLELGLEIV